MCLRHFLSFLMVIVIGSAAAQSLDRLEQGFDKRREEAADLRDDQLDKLKKSYAMALGRLLEKLKGGGSLDSVLPVHEELEALKEDAGALPDIPDKAPAELNQMRARYEESRHNILKAHAVTLTDLADKMKTALELQEEERTKAGKIKEAVTTRYVRERLEKDEEIIAARNLLKRDQTGEKIGGKDAWRSLLTEKATVVTEAERKVAVLSDVRPEHNPLMPFVTALKGLRTKPERILMTHAPAVIQYDLSEKVTHIRGKIYLGSAGGSVRFVIEADGKQVFDQAIMRKEDSASFELDFKPTKKIRLIVDPVDTPTHDWAAWLDPEIR